MSADLSEEDMAQLRAMRARAKQAQKRALGGILNLEVGEEEPDAKKARTTNGDEGATSSAAASSSSALVPASSTALVPHGTLPDEDEHFVFQGFPSMLAKMEKAENVKHALKVYENVHLAMRESRIAKLIHVELARLFAVLLAKPLTLDLIKHIDVHKKGGVVPSAMLTVRNWKRKGGPGKSLVPGSKLVGNDESRITGADGMTRIIGERTDIRTLLTPIELGMTQNIKTKSVEDVIYALYAVAKGHLLDTPFQNRNRFDPSGQEKNACLKIKDLLIFGGGVPTLAGQERTEAERIKALSTKAVAMLVFNFALVCNRHSLPTGSLQKIAPSRDMLRLCYSELIEAGLKAVEFAHLAELAFAVCRFNQLYSNVPQRQGGPARIRREGEAKGKGKGEEEIGGGNLLAAENPVSASADLGIAHREPQEEKVFQMIGQEILRRNPAQFPLKTLADIVASYANFGLKDKHLFEAIAPVLIKNRGKLSDHDFQAVMQSYIKFNLPFREETVGFRNVAVKQVGGFNRPAEKPKKDKFVYTRPEPLRDM